MQRHSAQNGEVAGASPAVGTTFRSLGQARDLLELNCSNRNLRLQTFMVVEDKIKEKLIDYLSKEIETHTNYITTLRSRMAFVVLSGPFFVLGSYLVAKKDSTAPYVISTSTIVWIVFLLLLYIAVAYTVSWLDNHAIDRCNKWRRMIKNLASNNEENFEEIEHTHTGTMWFYLILYAFSFISFIVTAILILQPRWN